jgi:hypothetical protein
MAREGEVTKETQQQLVRSAQAAGLYTEGANPPLLFHAQAEIPVAPLHARSVSLPPKDEYEEQLKPTPSTKKPQKNLQKKLKLRKKTTGRRNKKHRHDGRWHGHDGRLAARV